AGRVARLGHGDLRLVAVVVAVAEREDDGTRTEGDHERAEEPDPERTPPKTASRGARLALRVPRLVGHRPAPSAPYGYRNRIAALARRPDCSPASDAASRVHAIACAAARPISDTSTCVMDPRGFRLGM